MAPKPNIIAFIEKGDMDGLREHLMDRVEKREIDDGLFWAAMHGKHDAVTVLLDHGADVNKVDQFGSSVLHWAVQGNHFRVIDTILRAGADFRKWWTMEGESLLHWAAREGCCYLVSTLIELGVDTQLSDTSGRKPLHTACLSGKVGCLKTLLQLRPEDVNIRDDNGWTALHYAATNSSAAQRAVIHVLMRRSANPLIKTPGGRSALDLAFECGRVRALLEVMSPDQIFDLLLRVDDITHQKDSDEPQEAHCVNAETDEACESKQMSKVRRKYTFLQENFKRISRRSRTTGPPGQPASKGPPIVREEVAKTRKEENGVANAPFGLKSSVELRDYFGIWRKILQNDDAELLTILRDSERPCKDTYHLHSNFEECHNFSKELLCELFDECFENGLAIYSHVRQRYHEQIKRGHYDFILKSLTRLDTFKSVSVGGCRVMSPLSGSVLFLTVLCGRFRVAELLLRMRQFDVLPTTLLVTLIVRRWEMKGDFSDQTRTELNSFAERTERLAVDVLNQVYLKDNSEGKQTTLNFINSSFQTFSNMSIIDLAAKGNCTKFISLPCCQAVLTQLWLGKLHWLPSVWMWIGWFSPFILPLYFEREMKKKNEFLRSQLKKMDSKSSKGSPFLDDFDDDKNTLFHSYENLRQRSTMSYMKIVAYIYQSPAYKFFYYSLLYIIFLIKFSYVTTYSFNYQASVAETFCFVFVVGFAIEEVRLLLFSISSEQMPFYFKDYWNILSTLAIIICFIGFAVRSARLGHAAESDVAEASDIVLYIARVILLVGLMVFYLRLLFVVSLRPNLGPKMRMLQAMLTKDLLPMLSVFFVFFVSFGITFQGILYPNGFDLNRPNGTHLGEDGYEKPRYNEINSVKNIIKMTLYGMMAAEYNLENRDSLHSVCQPSDKGCVGPKGKDLFVYGFMILYVLIVNIMLVNLLIALYSNTVSQIDKESMAHWLADRYNLVQQFKRRSLAPPPFNILCVLADLINYAINAIRRRPNSRWRIHQPTRDIWQENVLINFLVTQAFALSNRRYMIGPETHNKKHEIYSRLNLMEDALRHIKTKLDEMSDQITAFTTTDRRTERRRLRSSIETVVE